MPERDEAGIRRYLLGLMPEPEAEALEHEYVARPEVLERVRAVEDDLLDDYAAGRLGPEEKHAFESRYLSSGPLRERVATARALRRAIVEHAVASTAAARRTWWRAPLAIAAGLLIALLVLGIWPRRVQQPEVATNPTPAPSIAVSASPSPSSSPTGGSAPWAGSPSPRTMPATTRLVLALSPGLLRGEAGPALLRIPERTGTVVLELEGDPALLPPAGSRLEAVIATVEGGRVWSGPGRRAQDSARPGVVAAISVPAQRLTAGDYLVTLSADHQILYRYFCRVPAR